MATSSNFATSNKYIVYWIDMVQNGRNVTNNTTNVTVKVNIKRTNTGYETWGNGTVYCTINGTQYTAAITSSDKITSSTRTLFTRTMDIPHNADGTKTLTMSAKITHSQFNSSGYPSWSHALTTIPRASTFSSSSMGANLKVSTANTLNVGISRASTTFTHTITLTFGGATIKTWTGHTTATSLALTAAEVNNMLNRTPNGTSGTATVTVQTKSGSTNVGGALKRSVTVTVDASVKPTVSELSTSISGSSRDKIINKYVQNISRVVVSFNSAAVGGATISANSVNVGGTAYNGKSITSGVLTKSGSISITVTTRDSRGRTATSSTTISVQAYSPPSISSFKVDRNTGVPTVTITRSASFSNLAGSNPASYIIQGKAIDTSSWTTIENKSGQSANVSGTMIADNINQTKSHEFTFTITDSFNKKVSAMTSVGTANTALSIKSDVGIGVGKVWEQGALDVEGDAFITGKVTADKGIAVIDTRDDIDNPEDIPPRAFSTVFKKRASVGNPPIRANDGFSHIIRIAGWNTHEYSGGWPTEISVGQSGMSIRQGLSANTWGPWRSMIISETGSVVLTPGGSGSSMNGQIWYSASQAITFKNAFPGTPRMAVTASTSVPHYCAVSVGATTPTGCIIYLYRRNTTATTVQWTASYD